MKLNQDSNEESKEVGISRGEVHRQKPCAAGDIAVPSHYEPGEEQTTPA